jgi:tRNA(fMet)-specific endonuclease VapC
MASAPLYLLDTNILVHFVRGSPVWRRIRDTFSPLTVTPTPKYCVVSEGEIRSLALQWGWAEKKLDQMEFCLGFFEPQSIADREILRMYATIDAYCESISQTMGKNDLWIAATAAVLGATLLTTDHDFDKLAPRFLTREWIDPTSSLMSTT